MTDVETSTSKTAPTQNAFGPLNIENFLTVPDEPSLLGDFGNFSNDTFTLEGTDLSPTPLDFNPANGDLTTGATSATPEPGTLFLLLGALALRAIPSKTVRSKALNLMSGWNLFWFFEGV